MLLLSENSWFPCASQLWIHAKPTTINSLDSFSAKNDRGYARPKVDKTGSQVATVDELARDFHADVRLFGGDLHAQKKHS
jgi:hypothetical protein